jgi:hypothetical protein
VILHRNHYNMIVLWHTYPGDSDASARHALPYSGSHGL